MVEILKEETFTILALLRGELADVPKLVTGKLQNRTNFPIFNRFSNFWMFWKPLPVGQIICSQILKISTPPTVIKVRRSEKYAEYFHNFRQRQQIIPICTLVICCRNDRWPYRLHIISKPHPQWVWLSALFACVWVSMSCNMSFWSENQGHLGQSIRFSKTTPPVGVPFYQIFVYLKKNMSCDISF